MYFCSYILQVILHSFSYPSFFSSEYKSVVPSDLYTALQLQAGNLDIANIMETWTTQPGYPVVTVERTGSLTYTITQQRFLLKNKSHTDATMWEIPLNYASSSPLEGFSATAATETLTKTQKTKQITLETDTEWKIFNVQQTGNMKMHILLLSFKFLICMSHSVRLLSCKLR